MNTNTAEARKEPLDIKVSDIINHLRNGVTRCVGDTHYDPAIGSIEEKYGLSKDDVKELFKFPKLAGIRIRPAKQKTFNIIDDTEETASPSKEYGAPTTSAKKRMESSTSDAKEDATAAEEVKAPSGATAEESAVEF